MKYVYSFDNLVEVYGETEEERVASAIEKFKDLLSLGCDVTCIDTESDMSDEPEDEERESYKEYMLENYGYAMDYRTNELNTTKLTELTADEFDIYFEDEIPDWLFDLTFEVEGELALNGKCEVPHF